MDYQTQEGTAIDFADPPEVPDFIFQRGSVVFNPGQTSKTVSVSVIGDTLIEPDETLLVNLSNPTNATIADGQGLGTIQDNDRTKGKGGGPTPAAAAAATLQQPTLTTPPWPPSCRPGPWAP